MSKKTHLLTAVAFVTVAATSMVTADARADETEELRECLASAEGSANEEQARSMCLWRYYDYMASYGP